MHVLAVTGPGDGARIRSACTRVPGDPSSTKVGTLALAMPQAGNGC